MEFAWYSFVIFLLLGILFGTISSTAGIGGGVFYVSFLMLLFGFSINEAIDTSTFIILISSAAGFLTYLKQKRTSLKLSLIFSCFTIIGSLMCTLIFLFIPLDNFVLRLIFAIVLLLTGLNMLITTIQRKRKGEFKSKNKCDTEFCVEDHDYRTNLKKGIPLFILAGFSANLLGIGGGVINTPVLNLVLGFPIHNATAISTSIIFFTAIYNTIIKSIYGQINFVIGILLAAGCVVGSVLGAKISDKMPKYQLRLFVGIVLIALGINMFF